jgi:hypothetical protein
MLAWLVKTPAMIKLIEKWSYDYIKMDCEDGKCYGVLAVSDPLSCVTALAVSHIGPPCLLRPCIISYHSQHFTHRRP